MAGIVLPLGDAADAEQQARANSDLIESQGHCLIVMPAEGVSPEPVPRARSIPGYRIFRLTRTFPQ